MEDDRSGSKRSMRALPQTPPPPSSRADLGVSAEHRPPSTRNLSSFAQAQEQQSAFAHQRQGSLVSSLTSRSSSEHATELPRAVIEEEEAEDDIPPPPPSLLTASLEDERPLSVVTSGELDRFEVRTAQRVDVTTPASRRDVSSTKPSPDLASRSPRPMASTSTFAPRAKSHDASPLPADASQRIQAASSEPTPSKSSMPSKSTASKRPKDVREPQFPNAKVEKAPTGALYWSKAPVHGRLPYHALRAHTSTLVGSSIWVFGGCDLRACFRDVWRLDLGELLSRLSRDCT